MEEKKRKINLKGVLYEKVYDWSNSDGFPGKCG